MKYEFLQLFLLKVLKISLRALDYLLIFLLLLFNLK